MATQFAESGTHIPGEAAPADMDQGGGAVDYEAEARKMGWSPPEEFKGDPKHQLDAETFYKRGQEMLPILRAQNKKLLSRLDSMERSAKQMGEFLSKTEQRAYEKALGDIRAQQEAAVESGDVEAHRAAAARLDKLEKPNAPAKEEISEEQRAEEFADWGKENKWYATNSIMQAYADSQANKLAKDKGAILDKADLDAVAEKVRAKFPEEFEDGGEAAPKPKRAMTEGAGNRQASRGGKTFNDLPPEARAACDKYVKQGYVKSREDYVRNYQW